MDELISGTDVDARDGEGLTKLMRSARSGNEPSVRALLDAGADPLIQNRRGQDALVLASIAGHVPCTELLRQKCFESRERRSREQVARLGVTVAELPRDKKGVFTSGVLRDHSNAAAVTEQRVLADARLAEEMVRTVPLTTYDGWLKQVSIAALNPMGYLALERAFPYFLTFVDFSEDLAHNVLTRRGGGVKTFHRPARARRYAGDDSLPRGRYSALCRDETGNDFGTLTGELWAYYRARDAGLVDIVDLSRDDVVERYAKAYRIEFPKVNGPALALLFLHNEQMPSPFVSLLGMEASKAVVALIPVQVTRHRIEGVVDLRQPATAQWFAHHFSRLTMEGSGAGWVHCWPLRPRLDSFEPLIPTLLSQERGGGAFHLAVGAWLRRHGVAGLIYPSVRSDCEVEVLDGKLVDSKGWNLVDYRDSAEPYFQGFFDISDYWEEAVRNGLGLGVGQLAEHDPYQNARIEFVREGPRQGSWSAVGIVEIRRALLEAEQEQYAKDVAQGLARPQMHWVKELPVNSEVQRWVAAFVAGEYDRCAQWGIALLPRIESFEILQMFLLSLHRLGKQPVAGGWNAAEVLEQLTPQLMHHHQHDKELLSLLGITLGLVPADTVIAHAIDADHRARAQYFGGARQIGEGDVQRALAYFDACVRSSANALEVHLALAESDAVASTSRAASV